MPSLSQNQRRCPEAAVAQRDITPPHVVWSSECSLHVVFPPGREACVPSAAARIAAGLQGVVDVVPGSTTVQVLFSPGFAAIEEAAQQALALARDAEPVSDAHGRTVEIPVCYHADFAPDLAQVAAAAGMSESAFAAAHAGACYTVRFLGFAPGFAYLDGLPPPLHTPRLATPRTRVPAGSVAIAGDRTGIYPAQMPGGWRLIGATPLRMFDACRQEPSLLKAGDRVRFRSVCPDEFDRLRQQGAG
ncbi:MAG: 5-oxoprolinase subunit PxpB [Phycisphaeraceae bacterium]|nr:5-oxoprolinase subunit PxpB [Phycisphaeraceae bacterium]